MKCRNFLWLVKIVAIVAMGCLAFWNMVQGLKERFHRVLVTGGRSGLGRAMIAAFQAEGIEVYGTSRRPSSDMPWLLEAELGCADGRKRFLGTHSELLRGVDLWIINAGSAALGFFPDQGEEAIAEQCQLMLEGPIHLAQFAWEGLRKADAGGLVFVSSLAAALPIPGMSVYNGCKAGLSQFANSLILENPTDKPQVIDWKLGDLKTEFNDHFLQESTQDSRVRKLRPRLDQILESSPSAESIVGDLLSALQKGRSGRLYSGAVFQTRLAMLGHCLLPGSWMHRLIRLYYRVR